ncbi:hypothetical protein ACQKL5_07220 [Peribacillus sp. NPDC097675]|uniref:hypothetical protein n=1 Tax=Peribacillus sp. NPDC097675 TaxID=3390618 RepID=UPI003CFBE2C3
MSKKQYMVLTGFLTFFLILSLLFTNTYFTHRGIMEAANTCYDHNGMPEVEKSILSINWSVICHP